MTAARATLARATSLALDVVLPPACPGCGIDGAFLCGPCEARLGARLAAPPGNAVGMPSDVPLPLVAHEWCVPYAGLGRAVIHALKYGGERRLAGPIGRALAARWLAAGGRGDLFVPIPVHLERRRDRGFDQAEEIARAAGLAAGVPVAPALVRMRRTVRQAELGRAGRAANVAGVFAVRPGWSDAVEGRWVVLIDDVMTTGATLADAACALDAAGAVAVSALTLARER